jgi:hypothetical protein
VLAVTGAANVTASRTATRGATTRDGPVNAATPLALRTVPPIVAPLAGSDGAAGSRDDRPHATVRSEKAAMKTGAVVTRIVTLQGTAQSASCRQDAGDSAYKYLRHPTPREPVAVENRSFGHKIVSACRILASSRRSFIFVAGNAADGFEQQVHRLPRSVTGTGCCGSRDGHVRGRSA